MRRAIIGLVLALSAAGCGTQRKLDNLIRNRESAILGLSKESDIPELSATALHRDTLTVKDEDGKEILIMRAVKDEDGEMVATDAIDAAVITARFRNVAERNGQIEISFDVTAPKSMQESRWQLRLNPDLFIMGDSIRLKQVTVTGSEYRKAQLRGYQQYNRFLSTIISDSTRFINLDQLEVFLKRNIPQVYKFRGDTSYVTDEEFASAYGVTERIAMEHYTNHMKIKVNDRRISRADKMFYKYVKAPIVQDGLRLDTVLRNSDNDFVYRYTQTIATRPELRKVDVKLSGSIFEQDKEIYRIPTSSPLTFYISSLSSFVDESERYLTRVIERRTEVNTACYIDFGQSRSEVDPAIGKNRDEIGRIQDNLASLIENRDYEIDSIVITASCSPEGGYEVNRQLSQKRSEAVSGYFSKFIRHYEDSLGKEEGTVYDLAGVRQDREPIRFISKSNPTNWEMLSAIAAKDSVLTPSEKHSLETILRVTKPEIRELALQGQPYYKYLREKLYPRLRTVKFDFHLHRKGMVKDTIHATVIDSTYMSGVKALRDRDYKLAIRLLRPYSDYNTAVAYCAMDYNASALDILEKLTRTDKVDYMLAILYSRKGDDQNAVQYYMDACSKNRSYVYRGNLDPEISQLIRKYDLNKDE